MQFSSLIETFRFLDFIDIMTVAVAIYFVYKQLKDTRAVSLLKGLLVLAFINVVSHTLNLYVINWILQQGMTVLLFALPVVFQPELRRALEQLGRGRIFNRAQNVSEAEMDSAINEVMAAARVMSREHTGALMVFEREVGLGDYIDTGILVDAKLSRELIRNIFVPGTPLHDGAMIIRNGRIMAAGCLLPLTEDRTLSTELGTRHRAAIGLSEQADCVVVVVSEETGKISYTYGGHIYRHLPEDQIKEALRTFMERPRQTITSMWKWGGSK
ncbi:diadenylate cyclase CdaA [Veillonella sp.]|jgi:diadenylate cyclase|uniref:diadenylate cyclase CdaA n=1 Tax=Veillonella sp. TaxID=1926307 RepID=UPI001B58E004|nr:diadenylate cyclase CdaA [Veillonella sp.]MBP8617228.1 diadenylate cyclase CdaA [Veillonella sp.]MBP9516650.1 diadenylate cyclase CdaA [Veillonella sp.]MBP9550653.1 diadenylate cyclase CdaA [Veillonella sp.]